MRVVLLVGEAGEDSMNGCRSSCAWSGFEIETL